MKRVRFLRNLNVQIYNLKNEFLRNPGLRNDLLIYVEVMNNLQKRFRVLRFDLHLQMEIILFRQE